MINLTFVDNFVAIARTQEFLMSLNVSVDSSRLTKWHPQFKLDELPDISSSRLPSAPESSKPLQAQEFLQLASGMDPRVGFR